MHPRRPTPHQALHAPPLAIWSRRGADGKRPLTTACSRRLALAGRRAPGTRVRVLEIGSAAGAGQRPPERD